MLAALAVACPTSGWALPLSPGDRIRVSIPADETVPPAYHFSGLYEVNLDGNLQVPFVDPLPVAGLELVDVENQITDALLQAGLFQPEFLQVSVQVVDWGPIQVTISGATFTPGRIRIDDRYPAETAPIDPVARPEPFTVSGEYPEGRYLTAALRSAGGLKPDADIRNILLIRQGQEYEIDLSGVLSGEPVEDIALITGDQVIVPELAQIQPELVRPSQVTPSAIAIFISNQTSPQGGGGQVTQIPYGSRFSQAVVAARCAGGSRSTNADRRATLIHTDRITGETQVLDQKVEDLLRHSNDTEINPYLMPEDSVICYDSEVTDVSNILDFVGNILNPFSAIRSIFFGN